jgi:hypothetical protein
MLEKLSDLRGRDRLAKQKNSWHRLEQEGVQHQGLREVYKAEIISERPKYKGDGKPPYERANVYLWPRNGPAA